MNENIDMKKENAQSFFDRMKKNPADVLDFEAIQDRVKSKVMLTYLNSQKSPMETKVSPLKRLVSSISFSKLVVFGFIPVLLMGLILLSIIIVSNDARKSNGLLKSEIAYTQGTVMYKKLNEEWKEASSEVILEEGDSLKTSSGAKAVLNLDDGSSVRLNGNSQITLVSMETENIKVANDKGEVYTRVAKLDRNFEVTINDATIKSLGTAYKTINTETKNGVEVYESKVEILGIKSDGSIVVEQGGRYYIVNTDNTELEGKVTEIIIDEIAQDEFVKWNKEEDEKVAEFKSQMGVLFDLTPPELEVSEPIDASSTDQEKLTVKGTTEKDAVVSINDVIVTSTDGAFSYEITLNPGANGIKIIALDPAGNKTVKNLTVTYDKEEEPTQTKSFYLTGTKVNNGVSLTWNVSGIDVSKGFKLVKSKNANPVYPGDDYIYISDSSSRNYTWDIQDGQVYHFRVCQYLGGTCGAYSNDITIQAPGNNNPVTSINLVHNGGDQVSWTVSGYSSKGFKLVWAESGAPVYPGSDYNYYSDPSTITGTVGGESGKTYNVRVCEYLGGSCGVYSNMITITL